MLKTPRNEWPDSPVSLFHMSYLIEVNCILLSGTHGELWRDVCNFWAVTKKCKSLTICSRLSSLLNWEMSQLLSIRGRQGTWRPVFRINFHSIWRGGDKLLDRAVLWTGSGPWNRSDGQLAVNNTNIQEQQVYKKDWEQLLPRTLQWTNGLLWKHTHIHHLHCTVEIQANKGC